ncbi:MAG TPA: sensor histidine kinase [Nitrospirae bacterium]|nr:sporulation kinase E [bacterium BMS3Abin09]GBE40486.1 sporulation kinase E [bacterium BMS3Bbin09]HDH33874.1 sensor histidine kinase [Nitrospirota bacterium]HDN95044.1 sensor histidine kinase [Nitrospirota bacterium]HDO66574.1 sensor histidine kinase [Nitrospirota bacterium]
MGLNKIFKSIAFRISVSIAVLVATATMTASWLILIEEKRTLETDLQSKGKYIAELMAQNILEPLRSGKSDRILDLLQGSMKSKESLIVYSEVYDNNRKLVAKSYKNDKFQKMIPPPFDFKDSTLTIKIHEDNILPLYHISLPIYEDPAGTIGFLRVCITKEFLNRTVENEKQKIYLLAASVIIIGILLGLWMARRVFRPILILNKGVQRLGSGEVGVEIPVVGQGEIKELALSFNRMSGQLKELIDNMNTAQENLVRTEKLYAIGEFSAGVAHEIRNPLTSIKMLIQALENKQQAMSGKNLGIIYGEIDRIDRIINEFLAFTRPGKTEKKDVNINNILEEVITITRPKMEQSGIDINENLSSALPMIKGNNDALKQVFINIVLNAIQAMDDEGGKLSIETMARNGNLSAIIKDTGIGIPEKNLKKIFDPFFTTKEEGTGMGLALTYAIINDHSGNITFKSTPRIGTTITVELPL